MARKTRPAAEVVDCRNEAGYRVFNLRNCRLHPHVFTSRLEALDFANDISHLGTRAATQRLETRLVIEHEARAAAALAAASQRITTEQRSAEQQASASSRVWTAPVTHDASREDITDLYGETAWWRLEVLRLTQVCALPTSNARTRMHNQMLLMNAKSMLEDAIA